MVSTLTAVSMSVFICAQPVDGDMAETLRHALARPGLDVFYSDVDLKPGDLIDRTVLAQLDRASFVVVLVTNNWPLPDTLIHEVDHDAPELVQRAIAATRANRAVLIPVHVGEVDDCRIPYGLMRVTPIRWASGDPTEVVDRIETCFFDRADAALASSARQDAEDAPVEPSDSFDLLVDNWLLQDVADVLRGGLSVGEARLWTPGGSTSTSAAVLQVEGLAHLLGALVMYDRLTLDEEFVGAWTARPLPALVSLKESGIVQPVGFSEAPELSALRATYIDRICVTEQLRAVQAENERAWAETGKVVHSVASQVIWGGAGYLARAELHGLPYQGHPARMTLLSHGVFPPEPAGSGATRELLEWLDSRRSMARTHGASHAVGAQVVLPPFLCEVVAEASSADDLIPVALQLRAHYRPLRRWLSTFERALYAGDPLVAARHRRDLEDAWSDARRALQGGSVDSRTLTRPRRAACTSPGRPAARTLLQKLVLAQSGVARLDELLRMLGMTPSAQRAVTRSALARRWSTSRTKP